MSTPRVPLAMGGHQGRIKGGQPNKRGFLKRKKKDTKEIEGRKDIKTRGRQIAQNVTENNKNENNTDAITIGNPMQAQMTHKRSKN